MSRNFLLKTKICTFWELGRCKRKVCHFAHGVAELHHAPDFTKTAMCRNAKSPGGCTDRACKYAHHQEELRIIDVQTTQPVTYSPWDAMEQTPSSSDSFFNTHTPSSANTGSTQSTLPDLDPLPFEDDLCSSYLGLGDEQPVTTIDIANVPFDEVRFKPVQQDELDDGLGLGMQSNTQGVAAPQSSPTRTDMFTEGIAAFPVSYKQMAIPVLMVPMPSMSSHGSVVLPGQMYQSQNQMQKMLGALHAMQKHLQDMEERILKAAMPDHYED